MGEIIILINSLLSHIVMLGDNFHCCFQNIWIFQIWLLWLLFNKILEIISFVRLARRVSVNRFIHFLDPSNSRTNITVMITEVMLLRYWLGDTRRCCKSLESLVLNGVTVTQIELVYNLEIFLDLCKAQVQPWQGAFAEICLEH